MENEEKVVNNEVKDQVTDDNELLDPNDFEETDKGEDESVEVDTDKEEVNKGKNSYFAQKRREQEAKAKEQTQADIIEKERKDAYLKGKLEAIKVNKFTDAPIEDEYDLEIYELQLELDKQGKDPVNDLASELARRNRSKVQVEKQKLEQENAKKTEMENDIKAFMKVYPKVDTRELSNNEDFQKFANDKFGRWSLTEIYEAYMDKKTISTNESTKSNVDANAEKLAKQYNQMPSSNASGSSNGSSQYENESYEDFEKRFNEKYRH